MTRGTSSRSATPVTERHRGDSLERGRDLSRTDAARVATLSSADGEQQRLHNALRWGVHDHRSGRRHRLDSGSHQLDGQRYKLGYRTTSGVTNRVPAEFRMIRSPGSPSRSGVVSGTGSLAVSRLVSSDASIYHRGDRRDRDWDDQGPTVSLNASNGIGRPRSG